ncbi:MAG: hypothetical protein ACOX2F_07310 [bacterium]
MNEKTSKPAVQSKTIQGIIIAATCFILGLVAQQAGIDYDIEVVEETLTVSVATITQVIGTLTGLYLSWKGRYNSNIKPIEKKKKED